MGDLFTVERRRFDGCVGHSRRTDSFQIFGPFFSVVATFPALRPSTRADAHNGMRDGHARSPKHVVSRALVLSNGALGAEGQCLGLARALGFHDPEVHLVGEAALALTPRFSAARSEEGSFEPRDARHGTSDRALARGAGTAQMVRRANRRVDPLPRAQSVLAKLLRLLPASLHVRLHELWERAFGARSDAAWLGADLAEVAAALRLHANAPEADDAGDTEATTRANPPTRTREAHETHETHETHKTLVLACGRGAVPAAAAVRRRHGDAAFVVVAQHPRARFSAFDLVVAPAHDADANTGPPRTLNLNRRCVVTEGALHRFDAACIAAARETWRDAFARAPAPRLVVAVGGPTRLCRFGEPAAFAAELVGRIATATSAPFASACVAFSARTPEAVKRAVERALREKGLARPRGIGGDGDDETAGEDDGPGARAGRARRTTPAVWTIDSASRRETWRGSSGENDAFAGAMAWADGVLVTADSCSMLSEAASLGVPVFVARFEHAKGKMSKFLAALATRGACVDAAAVFPNAPSRREADAAAERLASFVRYRRSVARDQPSSLARDLETAAARVRELVEVRAGGRKKARV